jgi:hypothetical protein
MITGNLLRQQDCEGAGRNIRLSGSHASDLLMLLTHFPSQVLREYPYGIHFSVSVAPFSSL